MKIIIDQAIPFIKDRFPESVEVEYIPGEIISKEKVLDADALIVRTRTKCNEALLRDSKVKLVATATIGTDHIDIPWCESHGIKVTSAPGCNAPGVAQYVLASLFSIGFDPRINSLGIIGFGHVGQIVGEWAKQIGINLLVCDPPRKDAGYKDAEYLDLEEVLKHSDAVTLHVPLTKEGKHPTHHIIGDNELEIMKSGAILINSSRGGVVDEKSLKKSLKEGHIKAIIDTWENEPAIDPELLSLVEIGTPHIAGYSLQGKLRGTRMVLESVEDILSLPVNLTGLNCEPDSKLKITKDLLINSYNPLSDYKNLISDVTSFEVLRNNYDYRPEPLFSESLNL